MKKVFEPSNALEGYMLQDLLKQRGIFSRIDGAQLQGGVGELPVTGFVRLMVEDDDYGRARAVIDEWEATAIPDPIPAPPHRPAGRFRGVLFGLALGIAGSYAFFRVPLPANGIDHNEDGKIDEQWFNSAGGVPIKTEVDRNFDGEVDYLYRYDRRGRLEVAEADDDFDGAFETRWQYYHGNVGFGEADIDGDSSIDLKFNLRYGVPASTEYFVPGSDRPVRVDYFQRGKLATAEVDTDRDGQLDTRHKYSDLAEIVSTEKIETP